MAISVVMPALEMAQETGKLVSWLKKEGDSVRKGEPLLEVETDKAVLEVEAAEDGVLAGISGEVGTDIPVGKVIAWIVAPGEAVPVNAKPAEIVTGAAANVTQAAAGPTLAPAASSGQISPKARRMAKEAGIDIATVRGSGPGGEVLASDIQDLVDAKAGAALTSAAPTAQPETLSSIHRLMAERTTQSWTTVPHFFVQRHVDATSLNQARTSLGQGVQQAHGVKLTHTDLLIAIVARTLAKHPLMNASWTGDGIRMNSDINVAIAMAVEDGVVTAVVPKASTLEVREIAKQRLDLTERARAHRLRPADLANGTFTISNLGMFHVDSFSAIITPPQAAILAVGAIAERVVPVAGNVQVRPMLTLTLSGDHRVLDGAKASAFLHDLAEALQETEKCLA
jgi:pyruvate dehydrogenase E2 component (dihydrolipoamide acetyltransferase)